MCLITNQRTPYIAEKDIIVYKALMLTSHEDRVRPTYIVGFEYILGRLYNTIITNSTTEYACLDSEDSIAIEKAYDIPPSPNAMYRKAKVNAGELMSYTNGFHSALDKDRLRDELYNHSSVHIFECIIPKGSEYYINASGLVISNAIIINAQIK